MTTSLSKHCWQSMFTLEPIIRIRIAMSLEYFATPRWRHQMVTFSTLLANVRADFVPVYMLYQVMPGTPELRLTLWPWEMWLECDSSGQIKRNTQILWWRHEMETFSALLVLCAGNWPVSDEFPAQMPVTRSFDFFFHLRLNLFPFDDVIMWCRKQMITSSLGCNTLGSPFYSFQYGSVDLSHS